jgi:hypothetical protein
MNAFAIRSKTRIGMTLIPADTAVHERPKNTSSAWLTLSSLRPTLLPFIHRDAIVLLIPRTLHAIRMTSTHRNVDVHLNWAPIFLDKPARSFRRPRRILKPVPNISFHDSPFNLTEPHQRVSGLEEFRLVPVIHVTVLD